MVFCNKEIRKGYYLSKKVTILILIDGFLQLKKFKGHGLTKAGHNPYFNRWFSAIKIYKVLKSL